MTTQPGLRERKKQRTRETISRAAHRLFAERGYHATTLPDIAEAADVSTRTIFAYFASKEDILFSDFPLMKDALGQALAERPEGEEALDTLRAFILSAVQVEKSEVDERLGECIAGDEVLRSHLRAKFAQLEEVITPAIAEDLGAPPDDLRPQLVAASLTAAFNLLYERDAGKKAKPRTAGELATLLDPVFGFLRGGLDALRR